MLAINDYVVRMGTVKPVGIVAELNLNGNASAKVRWGVDNNKEITEQIPLDELALFTEPIVPAIEVQRRQAKESGTAFHEIEE